MNPLHAMLGRAAHLLVLLLLLPTLGLAGARESLEAAILSLARKPYVADESRPTTDGRVDWSLIGPEMAVMTRLVPRWSEACRLHSEDPNHCHTVGEHGLRAMFHYASSPHAKSIQEDKSRLFLGCLTVVLHDMGKLDSPRDARGRQKKDPGHPALCAVYIRKHGRAMGLLDAEIDWSSQMLLHHRDLGQLERAAREPAYAKPEEAARWRRDLASFLRTRSNLDFLAALTEADVRGINGKSFHEWELPKYLPQVTEETARELDGSKPRPRQ